ncbi:hypothetical protein EC991_000918 [Linnemannia zychae]|nr:hypothetical protein EC991_000918 [Linnemannia zychae]
MNMFSQVAFWKTYITPDRYSHDQIPDLTGKVAIITGANTGLGYATTVALAAHGAHVFLACRDPVRAVKAVKAILVEIREKFPQSKVIPPKIEFLELDLMDLNKTRRAADEFLRKGLPLHILVNNAGLQVAAPFELSPDGIESRFAVNHMGHFLFTNTLLTRLKDSQPSRIVNVSSIAHEAFPPSVGIDFETLNQESSTTDLSRYGRSKLANVLFTKALARRLANERVYVNAVHPGFIPKSLVPEDDSWNEWFNCLVKRAVAIPAEKAALSQLYCATSPEIEKLDVRGRYFVPIANEIKPSILARDEELQEKLWAFSEDLVQEKVKM